jgi:Zn-dependent protease with chaperone function
VDLLSAAFENFIVVSSLLSVAGFVVAWSARWIARRVGCHPHMVTQIYTAVIIMPPFVAAWLVTAALFPQAWLDPSAFHAANPAPLHPVHLVGNLTAGLEPALAHVTLSLAAGMFLVITWVSFSGYRRIGTLIERLETNAAPPTPEQMALLTAVATRHGLSVGLVLANSPLSFVWGFSRSKLVLSSGLLRALTPAELTGVIEHEAAHHARRDNLVKLLLSILSLGSLVFPLSRLVLRWRAEQVELLCDEIAVARTSAPLEIAEALVKLRRATACSANALAATPASSFLPRDSASVECRVRRLIEFADVLPSPARAALLSRSSRSLAAGLPIFFGATLLLVSALDPLAIHTAAEFLIQSLK